MNLRRDYLTCRFKSFKVCKLFVKAGNELRRIYLESPDEYISGPLELPITPDLDQRLTEMYDNY